MTDYQGHLDILLRHGSGVTLAILSLSVVYLIFVLVFWIQILMKGLRFFTPFLKGLLSSRKFQKKTELSVQNLCVGGNTAKRESEV